MLLWLVLLHSFRSLMKNLKHHQHNWHQAEHCMLQRTFLRKSLGVCCLCNMFRHLLWTLSYLLICPQSFSYWYLQVLSRSMYWSKTANILLLTVSWCFNRRLFIYSYEHQAQYWLSLASLFHVQWPSLEFVLTLKCVISGSVLSWRNI